MRQIDKLHSFIKNPLNYGIRKNSRVYKCVCNGRRSSFEVCSFLARTFCDK